MSTPAFLRPIPNGFHLALKVLPRASRNEIAGSTGDELKIKVIAPPVDSAANEAVVRFLAEQLELPRGAVRLVRGNLSRHKLVAVTAPGLAADEICRRLGLIQRPKSEGRNPKEIRTPNSES